MVRYSIDKLLDAKTDILLEEQHLKVLLSRYYYYAEYNSNFEHLLYELSLFKSLDYEKESYLDEQNYKKANQKLLTLIFAFRESLHSKKERALMGFIKEKKSLSRLKKALKQGDTSYINAYIEGIS